MKTLILIRHAKSSWSDSSLKDYERPLNSRGRKDLKFMPAKLKEDFAEINKFLISSAVRTRQTSYGFKKNYNESTFSFKESLYLASASEILNEIQGLDPKFDSVAFVGHNPGITQLCSYLSEDFNIDNVPTLGICVFQSVSEWKDWEIGSVAFHSFKYPKMYKNAN